MRDFWAVSDLTEGFVIEDCAVAVECKAEYVANSTSDGTVFVVLSCGLNPCRMIFYYMIWSIISEFDDISVFDLDGMRFLYCWWWWSCQHTSRNDAI